MTYTLKSYTLTISGKGRMNNYRYTPEPYDGIPLVPWYSSKHTQGRGGEQGCSLPSSRVGSSREQILGVLKSRFWSTLERHDSGCIRVPERGTVLRSVYTMIIYYHTKFEPKTRKTQRAPLEGSAPPEGSGGELGETIFMMGLIFL